MKKKQKITFSELLYGICFAQCFFAFMLTEAFVNERCAVVLGSDAVNTVYSIGLVCTGTGFLSFSLLHKICKGEKTRKVALLIIGTLCLASAVILLIADRPIVFMVGAIAALLLSGHIGGCVYYSAAMVFAGSRYTGRIIGTGMGAAIFLQFIVQNITPKAAASLVSIVLGVAFVMFLILWAPKDWSKKNPLPPCFKYANRLQNGCCADCCGCADEPCCRND